jgi:hypothetical protein
MDKNDKKLELVKKLGVEESKKEVLEKQLELSSKVLDKVRTEINAVFKELGIQMPCEFESEGTDLFIDAKSFPWKLNLLEQKGIEYLARFALRISEELREEYRNRGEFSLLKAAEDVEAVLENNNYKISHNNKAFLKIIDKKKLKDEQFLHNIGLMKKGQGDDLDLYGSNEKNKDITDIKRSKAKNKENVTLKNYKQLRELAVKDLNFKISDQ